MASRVGRILEDHILGISTEFSLSDLIDGKIQGDEKWDYMIYFLASALDRKSKAEMEEIEIWFCETIHEQPMTFGELLSAMEAMESYRLEECSAIFDYMGLLLAKALTANQNELAA